MPGNIKGITISFNGDTTKLDKALREIQNSTRDLDKELKQVDKALKFNPHNVDLWKQKQQILTEKIEQTKKNLDQLKDTQAQLDAQNVDKNSEAYRTVQREIIATESKLKTYEGQLKKVDNTLRNMDLLKTSEQFKEMGNKLTAAGHAMREVSMAGAAVVGVLGTMAYKAGKAADDLNTMSKIYGISTQDLQKYKLAADQVDVSVETIAKSHVRLEKNMYSAKDGTGTAAEAFKTLGVAVTNADGSLRNGDQVWQDTIAALGKMENETERDALAMQLMGKSAAELNPLIEDGGETYKRTAELFSKYNLDLIDQDTLDRANEFNDSIDDIKSMGTLAFSMLGAKLADYLLPVMEKVVNVVGKFVGWLGNLDPKVLAIIGAIAGVVSVLAPLLIVLGKVAFAISSIMSLMGTLGISIAAIAGPIGIAIAVIAAIIAAIVLWKKHGDKFKKWIADFGEKIKDVFASIKASITKTWNEIKSFLVKVWDGIKAAARVAWEAIKLAALGPLYVLFNLIRTNWDSIKAFLTNTWNAIRTTATSAWNGIRTAIISPIQSAYSTLSGIWSSIRNTATSAFNSIWSTASSVWNNIRNAITSPINSAYSTVAGVLNRIRNLFPIGGGRLFSHITLPHFSWSWRKLGKYVSIPKISVDWYAKGGIFDSPTVAGLGEAGPEAVVPLDKFWDKMDAIAAASSGNGPVINVYATPDMNVNELATKIEQILVRQQKQRSMAYGGI